MAIKIDVVTELNERRARQTAAEAQRYFESAGRDAGNKFGSNLSDGIDKASPKVEKSARNIEKAFDKAATAAGRLRVEQEKLDALVSGGGASREKLIAQSLKVEKAHRDESSAVRDVSDAYRDFSRVATEVGSAASTASTGLVEMGSSLGKLGPIAAIVAVAGIGSAIVDLGSIAASASQSLLLLPAAAGAAGAAFGTLKLATLGFSDALGDIRDSEKFTEDLKLLSPVAQQAATAIQSLLPAFDGLKNATQDAFFAGVGPMLNTLANQYLPTIQNMTTGIASAFNSMLSGIGSQLMTPETQASMQTFMNNTVAAFQALAPAAAPLTKALTDLMAVGSGFLPGLAQAATDAANSFSKFITEASRSGQLKQWIGEGLDTLKDLGSIAWEVGKAFMALAPTAREILPQIVELFRNISDFMPGIVYTARLLGPPIEAWNAQLNLVKTAFGDIKFVVTSLANTLIPIINRIGHAIDEMLEPIRTALKIASAGTISIPHYSDQNMLVQGGSNTLRTPGSDPTANLPTAGLGSGSAQPAGSGIGSSLSYRAPGGGWSPASALGGAGGRGGGGPATTPYIDPSKFAVGDPLAGMPAPSAMSNPADVYAADTRALTAAHNLEQGKLALAVLEAKGNATQQELLTAKNNLQEQERALYEAQFKDLEARRGKMDQAQSDLKGVFGALDEDFGVSGGIPGIVKNLTLFLGNLALASAINSSPTLQAGAMSIAAGNPVGLFAQQGVSGVAGVGPTAGGIPTAGGFTGGAYGGDAALLANVPAGRYTQTQGADLTKGLADCSSAVEDLVNLMDGNPTSGRSMATGNAATWLPQHGFQPGMGGPGDFRVGFNDHHMQATLPGGTPFNWGSDAAAANGGVGGTGAYDPAFTDHYYRPAPAPSAMGPAPLGGGVGAPLPWGGPGIPNMGGGGGGVPGSPMAPNSMPGAAPGQIGQGVQSMQPSAGAGGGGVGVGGITDAAAGAASALDMIAPGAGQAASVGIKLAGRAIQQGAQVAAIGASGLMETFLPHDSALAGNSWFSKIAGGLSGARPAQPNAAGKAQPAQQQGPQQGGDTHNDNSINVAQLSTEGKDGQGVVQDLSRMKYSAGQGR